MIIDTYYVASINRTGRKISVIILEITKNQNNQILRVFNTKEMVEAFDTQKEALDFIKDKEIDYIISSIQGLSDNYIYINNSQSKSLKGSIFTTYKDAYPNIDRKICSRPQQPISGQIFEQDRVTYEYIYFLEKIDPPTFAVMFGVYQVQKSLSRQQTRELKKNI